MLPSARFWFQINAKKVDMWGAESIHWKNNLLDIVGGRRTWQVGFDLENTRNKVRVWHNFLFIYLWSMVFVSLNLSLCIPSGWMRLDAFLQWVDLDSTFSSPEPRLPGSDPLTGLNNINNTVGFPRSTGNQSQHIWLHDMVAGLLALK